MSPANDGIDGTTAREAAFLKRHPPEAPQPVADGIGGTDDVAVSPAQLRGARYANIRKALTRAPPTDNQTYLLAQIALLLCDVQECMEDQNNLLLELIVHRKPL